MTMTDEELDRDWKPNARRPQSTVAQMFSQELMDIFRIDNSVADLDEQVDKRKQQINSQTSELEALEARIREMEARLKGQTPGSSSSASSSSNAAAAMNNSSAPPAPPAKDYPAQQQQNKYPGSRPGTARQGQQAVPGALPPTPAGSEGEFEELSVPVAGRAVVVPRPSGAPRLHLDTKESGTGTGTGAGAGTGNEAVSDVYLSSSRANELLLVPGDDARSIKSVSETASFADYVIVPNPDGDRERDI